MKKCVIELEIFWLLFRYWQTWLGQMLFTV